MDLRSDKLMDDKRNVESVLKMKVPICPSPQHIHDPPGKCRDAREFLNRKPPYTSANQMSKSRAATLVFKTCGDAVLDDVLFHIIYTGSLLVVLRTKNLYSSSFQHTSLGGPIQIAIHTLLMCTENMRMKARGVYYVKEIGIVIS